MPQPKISFAFTADEETIEVFGVCDEVELTAGVWPNCVALACPVHEYDKFADDYARQGELRLYWSSDSTPDVTLAGWSIDSVSDSRVGTVLGEEAPSVFEKTIYLTDRRWEFTAGRGGALLLGLVNKSLPDGSGVSNPPGLLGEGAAAGASFGLLVKAVVQSLRYASGLAAINTDLLPSVQLDAVAMPRDLKWDGIHAPTELQRLLEEARAVLACDTAGNYSVAMIGEGDAPAPVGTELPSDTNYGRPKTAPVVVVTSAPTKAITETTLGMEAWEYVWFNSETGEFAAMTPGEMATLLELFHARTTVPPSDPIWSTIASLFCVIRLKAEYRHLLPILTRGPLTFGSEGRALGVRVKAAQFLTIGGRAYKPDALRELHGFTVDEVNGMIRFPSAFGTVNPAVPAAGSADWQADFYPHVSNVEITIPHEAASGTYDDWFVRAFRRVGGISVTPVDYATLSPTEEMQIISVPQYVEYRSEDYSNTASLELGAQTLAERALAGGGNVRVRRFVGFHNVSPSGRVSSVKWSLREGTTSWDETAYYIGRGRYIERTSLAAIASAASGAKTEASATPHAVSAGAGPYARPAQSPGVWEFPQPPKPSGLVAYGKPTAAFSSGATITLDPCDMHGTDNGLPNVTAYVLSSKGSYTMATGTTIPTTAIVPYAKGGDGNYYLLGSPLLVVTDYRVDGANLKLQKRVRNVWVNTAGTDSDWVDVHTGTACTT